MKPYYDEGGITLYHGDAREVLPERVAQGEHFGAIVTDPVWPGASIPLVGSDRPEALFGEVAAFAPALADRLVVHLGRNTDPRMLALVPSAMPFLAACWLRLIPVSRAGRLMKGGELAYVFGALMKSLGGHALVPSDPPVEVFERIGEGLNHSRPGARVSRVQHPCPRHLSHALWLVRWFGGDRVLDPFAGSGTTLVAAKAHGIQAVGVEIEERFCEVAVKRLAQGTLFAPPEPEAEPATVASFAWPPSPKPRARRRTAKPREGA